MAVEPPNIHEERVKNDSKIKAKVFISCGQSKDSEEVHIAEQVATRLKEKGFNPYIAVQQQNLRGLKESIFEELSTAEYFLFIDFKREKLDDGQCRGSLFSHQELAIASFLEIHLLGFREKGVKEDDGIIRFLQANCTFFTDRHTLVNVVADKIELKKWKPDWKNQLVIERDSQQFSDAYIPSEKKNARFFHVTVRNLNPYKMARNCYAFLETIIDPKGNSLPVECVEFKWAGYVLPNATILSSSSRSIDGFYVFHDTPNIPKFNVFTDSTRFFPKIEGSGDYELTFLVVSDNFKPVRKKIRMHLGNRLEDIRFE